MLSQLLIRHFAIIEEVDIAWKRGLTVLTGETGAGKSILVDALQLLIGARAGAEVVRSGSERAEISATFDLEGADPALRRWLDEQGVEASEELLVRRLISRDGKSRAFLNGQPVTVQSLREVGQWLADIHGQHDFQSLMRTSAQRELLDRFAGCSDLATQVRSAHAQHVAALAALSELEQTADDREARIDRLSFQLKEIESLQPSVGETTRLGNERQVLANVGRLAESARQALDGLYEGEHGNARDFASRSLAALTLVAPLDDRLAALLPALEESLIGLTESAQALARYVETLEGDPQRLEQIEQRLAAIESLARKHRCHADELPQIAEQLREQLAPLEDLGSAFASRRQAVDLARQHWLKLAQTLSLARQTAGSELADSISIRMQTLGMAGGRFEVALTPVTDSNDTRAQGLEEVQFLVTANAGQAARPLAKVASGGELSRLSLAVQVTLAHHEGSARAMRGGCMVFDEVDAGVGGAVAEIVGRELAALARHAQVLCVTHLPQVAALGQQHLKVSKTQHNDTTHTEVQNLPGDERTEEIARMLGGIAITSTTREHAAEMLNAAETTRESNLGVRAAGRAHTRRGAPGAKRGRPATAPRPRDADSASSGSARKSPKRDR